MHDEKSASVFTAAVGPWSAGEGPLYLQLTHAVQQAIRRGDLAPGTRLPPERVAAAMLAVSRGTVMATYAALREQGWVESRRGSGTWIRPDAPRGLRPDAEPNDAGSPFRRFTSGLLSGPPGCLDLGVSVLPSPRGLPEGLLTIDADDLAMLDGEHGYRPAGLPALREALAAHQTDLGEPCDSTSIVVTGGAQQALAIAMSVTLRRGDVVVVESPTYPGAVDAILQTGARVVTVPSDDGWADISELRRVVEQTGAAAVYLIPTCHNPTGSVMSETRRRAIARFVDERGIYLFEDESLADLVFDGTRPRSISSWARSPLTVTIGSLGKSVWGGLRLGWLRASPAVADRAVRAKTSQDLGLSVPGQLLGLRALGALPQVTAVRRAELRSRAELLRGRLEELLPEWTVSTPRGGLSLWVGLPDGDADLFAQHALRRGVSVSSGRDHCPDGEGRSHLRVAFALEAEELEVAAGRLRLAWDDYAGRTLPWTARGRGACRQDRERSGGVEGRVVHPADPVVRRVAGPGERALHVVGQPRPAVTPRCRGAPGHGVRLRAPAQGRGHPAERQRAAPGDARPAPTLPGVTHGSSVLPGRLVG
jgi:DNA-binding transcriptional MocR family regulator